MSAQLVDYGDTNAPKIAHFSANGHRNLMARHVSQNLFERYLVPSRSDPREYNRVFQAATESFKFGISDKFDYNKFSKSRKQLGENLETYQDIVQEIRVFQRYPALYSLLERKGVVSVELRKKYAPVSVSRQERGKAMVVQRDGK